MGATSIHVQAVKPGSEIHNFREKELDYVRPELSHLNESWVGDSISHRLESAKQRYLDTVGQKMQAKAAPIREGVIVIKQETTMQELQQFATVCKERFGIEAFQIHIHKDEGYMNAKQWTPNLHAHVVFDWTQPNGKSVRLSRDDMAELQTIASETLGMERGVSSDRKHLSAMQYKTECAKEQLQELSNDISSALDKHKDVQNQLLQLQKELRSIETKKNVQKLISKASEKFYGLIGKTVNDREKDALKAKVKALEGENAFFHEFHVFISQVKAVINLSYAGTDRKYHVFHIIFDQSLNLIFHLIRKLVALSIEELDPVKFHWIV